MNNRERILEQIESNLYSFYDFLGNEGEIPNYFSSDYSWINAGIEKWPGMIYRINAKIENVNLCIQNLVKQISNQGAPKVMIHNPDAFSETFTGELSSFSFKPFMLWEGMALKLISYKQNYKFKNQLNIEKITNPGNQLNDWIEIVNNELLKSNNAEANLFTKFLWRNEIDMFIGYFNNVPVSTILVYYNNNIAGLYMITTDLKHRAKGFAKQITITGIESAIEKNMEYCILHATKRGEKLYRKLDFNKYCRLVLSYKID